MNENKTNIKKSSTIAGNIVMCALAALTVCFTVPMDIFLANAFEIAFPIKPLMLFMGLVTTAVFAVLFLACTLTKGKANNILRAAVFGVSAGFYIQGNFLAVNMGVLNGSAYYLPAWKAVLNTGIWLVILAAPFFILIKFPQIFDNVLAYVSAAIILIQALSLAVSVYVNIPRFGLGSMDEVLYGDKRWINTAADIDIYSKNKNFIIILADAYDSFCFDSAIKDDRELVSEFDGFTYYANTVGKFNVTPPSVAYIMAGNKKEEYNDLTFFDTLSKNYKTNFYCHNEAPPAEVTSKYSDNIILKKISLADTSGYAGGMYKISFFRCVPEILKPLFRFDGDLGQELNSKTTDNLDLSGGMPIYSYDNLDFYYSMPRELKPTDENVFKFIYIFGLHEPRTVTRDLERVQIKNRVSPEEGAAAVNRIINEYLKILKDNGVYDNSEIIFMADHGHYENQQYPLLMYKPAHQTETGIKVSNAPISYDDLFPTLVKLAGGEPNGRTIFDIGEDEERVRHFETTNEDITGNIKQDPQ